MGFIYDWCEERLEIQSIADDILAKFVPAHVNIFYCFGGIMVTSFIFHYTFVGQLEIYSSLVIRSYGSNFDSSHCKSLFNWRF